jgi:hypothetical protein
MKNTKIIFSFLVLFLVVSCQNEEIETKSTPKSAALQKFSVPVDSVLSTQQILSYKKALRSLLSFEEKWVQDLSKMTPEEQILKNQELNAKRDRLCRQAGLRGMDEYLWIDSLGVKLEKNRSLLKTSGVLLP